MTNNSKQSEGKGIKEKIKDFLNYIFAPRVTVYKSEMSQTEMNKVMPDMSKAFKMMDNAFEEMDKQFKKLNNL